MLVAAISSLLIALFLLLPPLLLRLGLIRTPPMLHVIDNYDSFTFNLVQYLGELAPHHPIAQDLRVERNDSLSIEDIQALQPKAVLLYQGQGIPISRAFVST